MTDQTTTPDSIIPPEVRTPEAYRAWRAERDTQVRAEAGRTLPSEEDRRALYLAAASAMGLLPDEIDDIVTDGVDAVLALLATAPTVEQVRQEAKAEALRVASAQCSNVAFGSNVDVAEWLMDRADRIESQETP